MTPYRTKASIRRRNLNETPRRYEGWDITVRSLSAIGILLVGIAGWRLQSQDHADRQAMEARRLESKRFLPLLRSLTELEMVVVDTANQLHGSEKLGRDENIRRSLTPALAWRMQIAARRVVVAGNDPKADIEIPMMAKYSELPRIEKLGVRASALTIGDMLQFFAEDPSLGQGKYGEVVTAKNWVPEHGLLIASTPGSYWPMVCTLETVKTWRVWFGDKPVAVASVFLSLPEWLRALHLQILVAVDTIIADHPELGDAYAEARADIVLSYSGVGERRQRPVNDHDDRPFN